MSRLAEKYNIPVETINRMVKDGVISCTIPTKEAVFKRYTELVRTGAPMHVIYECISKETGIPDTSVRHYIYSMKNL